MATIATALVILVFTLAVIWYARAVYRYEPGVYARRQAADRARDLAIRRIQEQKQTEERAAADLKRVMLQGTRPTTTVHPLVKQLAWSLVVGFVFLWFYPEYGLANMLSFALLSTALSVIWPVRRRIR